MAKSSAATPETCARSRETSACCRKTSGRLPCVNAGPRSLIWAPVLNKGVPKAWRKRAAFGLGLVGAAWRLSQGDPFGALLAVGAAAASADLAMPSEAGAYSYLFKAQARFP